MCFRESEDGREGMVLLLPKRPEIPDRNENEPGHGIRILESDRERQGNL